MGISRGFILILTLVGWMGFHCSDAADKDDVESAKKLRLFLINSTRYDRTLQPIDKNSVTLVNFTIHARKLRYMEPTWSYMSMNSFICVHWQDDQLSWKKSEHNLVEVHFGVDEIWTPSLSMLESYAGVHVQIFSTVIVNNKGNAKWCPLVYFGIPCSMDLKDFPYDEHRCGAKISSWSPHGYPIKLVGKVTNDVFEDSHPDWTAKIDSLKENTFNHPELGKEPTLEFSFTITRKSSNYHYTVVLPMAVVALLTLLIFWLPPTSGKRITIGCANLIIIVLILMMMTKYLGRSLHTPTAVKQLGITAAVVGVSLIVSAIVLNMVKSPIVFRPPLILTNLLSGTPGRMLLLCPLPAPRSLDHVQLTDATSPLDKEDIIRKQEWFLFAQFIDRISFILFTIILLSVRV